MGILYEIMMTSSNGNLFRVTGPLCGEFTGPGEFPTQRPVTRSFDVFFDMRLNKRLSKHPWGWWFETLPCPLWRHCKNPWAYCMQYSVVDIHITVASTECRMGHIPQHVYGVTAIGNRWLKHGEVGFFIIGGFVFSKWFLYGLRYVPSWHGVQTNWGLAALIWTVLPW